MPVSTRIAGLGVYLPETVRRTADTERRLRARNPHVRLATGLISRMTGVRTVHERPAGWQASDLAVAASRQALDQAPGPIDLVIFASASQDLVEPATSHIVAAKLASTALIARIFILTKPALMQIGWFARAYDVIVPWQEALFAYIRNSWVWRYGRVVKERVARQLKQGWNALRPQLANYWARVKPGIARLRERFNAFLARLLTTRRDEENFLPSIVRYSLETTSVGSASLPY